MRKKLTNKGERDLKLINRAIETGDPKAYAELMKLYRDPLYFMIYEKISDQDVAKDLTIESLGKAFKKLHLYEPKFAFSTWLFKIASNHSIDFIRKKRIKALSLDKGFTTSDGDQMQITVEDDAPDPFETLEKKQRVERMRLVVSKLKPRYRRLVELRYFEELSYDEIAKDLDLPLGTVKAQLYRARDILASVMEGSKEHL